MYIIKRMPEFDEWLGGVKDTMTRIQLGVQLDKAQRGLLGDFKPVDGYVQKCASSLALAGACITLNTTAC